MRERRERHAEESYFSSAVAVSLEQFLYGFKNDGVEMRGFAQRVGASDGFKSCVADRDRDHPSTQPRFAQPLHRFLAQQAERRVERGGVPRVL